MVFVIVVAILDLFPFQLYRRISIFLQMVRAKHTFLQIYHGENLFNTVYYPAAEYMKHIISF